MMSLLLQNQEHIFNQDDQSSGCPKDETMGHYLSRLIVFGSSGVKHSFKIICEKYDLKTSQLPPPEKRSSTHDCKVSSDLKKLEKINFSCPGTP